MLWLLVATQQQWTISRSHFTNINTLNIKGICPEREDGGSKEKTLLFRDISGDKRKYIIKGQIRHMKEIVKWQ